MDSQICHELDRLLERHCADGAVGLCLAFSIGGAETVEIRAGNSDRSRGVALKSGDLFKIGSCTKTFVAAALMKLAADELVDLDEPIERWFPDLPHANKILVRQLINHRSGLPEFEFGIPMTADRTWKPDELVKLAFDVGQQSPPGGTAVYNNTGYVLAGMLIESVSGGSLASYVRRAVLEPLHLRNTFSPATEAFPSSRLVCGHYLRAKPAEGASTDIAAGGEMWRMEGILPYSEELQDSSDLFPFTGAYGCGDMVSTAVDLVDFLKGLFACRLWDGAFLKQMMEERAPMGFPGTRNRETGAGLLVCSYSGRSTFGHQGSIPGYVTVMQYEPESALAVALTSNSGSGNRLSFHASGMHPLLDEVIDLLSKGKGT